MNYNPYIAERVFCERLGKIVRLLCRKVAGGLKVSCVFRVCIGKLGFNAGGKQCRRECGKILLGRLRNKVGNRVCFQYFFHYIFLRLRKFADFFRISLAYGAAFQHFRQKPVRHCVKRRRGEDISAHSCVVRVCEKKRVQRAGVFLAVNLHKRMSLFKNVGGSFFVVRKLVAVFGKVVFSVRMAARDALAA